MCELLIRVILLTTLDTPQAECEEDEGSTDANAEEQRFASRRRIMHYRLLPIVMYSSSPPESGDP